MANPNLAPVFGVRDPAAYTNLQNVKPILRSAVQQRAAARSAALAESQIKAKVEQANRVLDALEAREKALAKAIKALDRQKKATAKRVEKIEDAILSWMEESQLKSVEGLRVTFRAQTAAPALVIDDVSKVPDEYLRQPPIPAKEPDKLAIKAALAANEDLAPEAFGARLVSKVSLIRT